VTATQDGEEQDGLEVGFGGHYPVDRNDILALAEHLYETLLDFEYRVFFGLQSEFEPVVQARRRFVRIADMVGEVETQKIIQQVREKFRREHRKWGQMFLDGLKAETQYVEYYASVALNMKKYDEATCRAAHEYLRTDPCGVYHDPAGDMWFLGEPEEGADSALLVV
jgi:hypothetical protein